MMKYTVLAIGLLVGSLGVAGEWSTDDIHEFDGQPIIVGNERITQVLDSVTPKIYLGRAYNEVRYSIILKDPKHSYKILEALVSPLSKPSHVDVSLLYNDKDILVFNTRTIYTDPGDVFSFNDRILVYSRSTHTTLSFPAGGGTSLIVEPDGSIDLRLLGRTLFDGVGYDPKRKAYTYKGRFIRKELTKGNKVKEIVEPIQQSFRINTKPNGISCVAFSKAEDCEAFTVKPAKLLK